MDVEYQQRPEERIRKAGLCLSRTNWEAVCWTDGRDLRLEAAEVIMTVPIGPIPDLDHAMMWSLILLSGAFCLWTVPPLVFP